MVGDGFGGAPVVAGQHGGFEAKAVKGGNGLLAALFQGIADRDHRRQLAVDGGIKRRLGFPGQSGGAFLDVLEADPQGLHIPIRADLDPAAFDGGFDPESGQGLEIRHRRDIEPALPGGPLDGFGDRVFALGLGGGDQAQGLVITEQEIRQLRPSLGQRPRLVQHHGVDAGQDFERRSLAEQHPHFGALSGPDHDRRRRRQPHGARTRDQQHRHRGHESETQRRIRPECQPHPEGGGGGGDDDGHEDRGDLVGEPLDRRFGALRLLDHPDDLGEHRMVADPRGLKGEGAGLVDGAADHLGARRFLHRHRFAGNHGFVDVARALGDDAVHGQALAGADQDQVPRHHVLDGNFHLLSVPDYVGRLGPQPHQLLDRLGSSSLGDGLEVAAEQDQGDDDAGGLEIGGRRALGKDIRGQKGGHRIEIGGTGAEHDEAVHAGVQVPHFGPAVAVENPPGVELHGRRQDEFDPHPSALGHQ